MVIVISLAGGIDTNHSIKIGGIAVFPDNRDLDGLRGRTVVQLLQISDVEGLSAIDTQGPSGLTLRKLRRDNARADEARAVNTSERLSDNSLDAQ